MGCGPALTDGLRSFRERLSRQLPVERMLLFGSRARGDHTEESDVDLIIVSPAFRNRKFQERGVGLYRLWETDLPVDFLCFTPEEFEERRKGVTIVSEALREGVEVRGTR